MVKMTGYNPVGIGSTPIEVSLEEQVVYPMEKPL